MESEILERPEPKEDVRRGKNYATLHSSQFKRLILFLLFSIGFSFCYWMCCVCHAVNDVTESEAVSIEPNHYTRWGQTTRHVTCLRTPPGVRWDIDVIFVIRTPPSPVLCVYPPYFKSVYIRLTSIANLNFSCFCSSTKRTNAEEELSHILARRQQERSQSWQTWLVDLPRSQSLTSCHLSCSSGQEEVLKSLSTRFLDPEP